ncbi:MAG TPA: transglycosylase SLT domain-containing protein [bacterium]|nr:transglycosylase SLT domain-containing protein [bacterium]
MKAVAGAVLLSMLALPAAARAVDPYGRAAVGYMQSVIEQVNPALVVEDAHCARELPAAIYRQSRAQHVDWRQVFVLAWQESAFDCHAKSGKDKGGAYGPFQIRRMWQPITGDPRYRYYDPELAARRVVKVLRYYLRSDRHGELLRRGFRNPLLCLYNTGETQDVNMDYCRQVGEKMDLVRQGWQDFKRSALIARSD